MQQRLSSNGHHGLVATEDGRAVAVMTAAVRENPATGRYARLPAEGFAVEPNLADPTGVLGAAFGNLAAPLIADGVLRYYLLHAALPRLPEALSNLGFGRNGATASSQPRPSAAPPPSPCTWPGSTTSRPSHASPWSRSSTAPRRRYSHPAKTGH